VNSGEKPNSRRISSCSPYIHGRLANMLEFGPALKVQITQCALRPNSSKSCAPGFRFGSGGRRVKLKKRTGVEGAVAVPAGEVALVTVNDQKGFYHDFSSGKHGDIISFSDGDRGRRLRRGRRAAGVDGRHGVAGRNPDAAKQEQRRKTLYDVMELAAKFFADTLASRNGAKARGYLADRAISPATQLQFRLAMRRANVLR